MLGHALLRVFSERFPTHATVRRRPEDYPFEPGQRDRLHGGVDVRNLDAVIAAMGRVQPDVVVNAAGLVKQLPQASDPILGIQVNALFPQRLASLCQACGARLLHVSTDCVFSGRDGNYSEDDRPDPVDLYGLSKLLGEPPPSRALTIRTSIIGRQLTGRQGLLEWFLNTAEGRVQGYTRARFSGLTTTSLARVLAAVIEGHDELSGLYHVAAEPITKYDLLCRIREAFGKQTEIEPHDGVICDRTLDGTRFREATGIDIPDWATMISGLTREGSRHE